MNSNWTVVVVCLISLGIGASQAQANPDLDDLLNRLFTTEPPKFQQMPTRTSVFQPYPQAQMQPQPNRNPAPFSDNGRIKVCGENMECVPRFQCNKDGTVNADGTTLINIRVDGDAVCTYLEECCYTGDMLTEPKYHLNPVHSQEGCGFRNPDGAAFRITGAEDGEAEFGEFPWMVAILKEPYPNSKIFTIYECGGSVIAPNVVLTAPHCVQKYQPYQLVARAGEWDLHTTQEVLSHQDARVKEIIRHENYNKGALFNDVALLILETPFHWEENVRPICLPEANANFDFARCYATGWGKDKFGKDGISQSILKKIDLPMMPRDTCQANLRQTRLGRFFNLDRSFMCAGGERGKDTCKGDGGSPLVCPDPQNPKRYYQVGIVAWGIGCAEENIPGVYANVPYLRNWINQKLSARGIDFKYFTV